MRTVYRTAFAAAFMAVGYVLGTLQIFDPAELKAQGAAGGESSTSDKIKAAQKAVEEAQQAMVLDKSYQPVIEGLNSFAVTVGGVDALKDPASTRRPSPDCTPDRSSTSMPPISSPMRTTA